MGIVADFTANENYVTSARDKCINLLDAYFGGGTFTEGMTWGEYHDLINDIAGIAGLDTISSGDTGQQWLDKMNDISGWLSTELLLDGVAPSLVINPKRSRYIIDGDASTTGTALTVSNNSAIRTYIDQSGALVTAAANTPRIDWSFGYPRLLLEGAATNFAENSGNTGAVVGVIGAGGALPSYTTVTTVAGITLEVKAIGTTNGVSWTEIRVSGTNTSGAIAYPDPSSTNRPVAAVGETWSYSFYASLVAGVWPSNTSAGKAGIGEYSAANSYLADTKSGNIISTWARHGVSRTLSNASVGKVRGYVSIPITAGETVDFTIRIGGLQLEKSPAPTSLIHTAGTVLTRTADLATLHASAGDMTAWAWRGYVPSLIASQFLLGATGGAYILAGNADKTALLLEGSNTNATVLPPGQLPGNVGFCGGWGASGRRCSNNGGATGADAVVPDRSRTTMFIGPSTGLVPGQVIYIDELVGWVLPDRPTAAGVQSQARAAA